MTEKRKVERIKKTIKSEIRSDEALTYSTSVDMSNGGIFISTPEPLGNGTKVELSISIPGDGDVTLQGVVRWIREEESSSGRAGMGIEFQNLDDSMKKKLGDFIK